MKGKFLFIDREGALAVERPPGLALRAAVIPSLLKLQTLGYRLVMYSDVSAPSPELTDLLASQGVVLDDILLCHHEAQVGCLCRKPNLGLVQRYLAREDLDRQGSYVIGSDCVDLDFARQMGMASLLLDEQTGWPQIVDLLNTRPRRARVTRKTRETAIAAEVNLDGVGQSRIHTGIGYFDHMLEQLSKHGGFDLSLEVQGDLGVDEHHTVEDTALVIGECLDRALSDRHGIGRYGFLLPMDEAEAKVAIDLSGRAFLAFQGRFPREYVGELPTELVPHFFRSFSDALRATLHIEVSGENAHHMAEAVFKSVGRALRPALAREARGGLPSTKGIL